LGVDEEVSNWRFCMRSRFVTIAGLFAFVLIGPVTLAQAQDDAVKKGQDVYAAQKCSMCHSIAGKGSKTSPLDGVGTKLSAADIRAWITDPVAMTAKTKSTKKPPMPAKYGKLAAAEIDALVAYMQSLK
jgi:mono/diheme cytochrome c family protein